MALKVKTLEVRAYGGTSIAITEEGWSRDQEAFGGFVHALEKLWQV